MWRSNEMREYGRAMACEVRGGFEMWLIAAGVLVGTFIALTI
jgi:hypothetical protein